MDRSLARLRVLTLLFLYIGIGMLVLDLASASPLLAFTGEVVADHGLVMGAGWVLSAALTTACFSLILGRTHTVDRLADDA